MISRALSSTADGDENHPSPTGSKFKPSSRNIIQTIKLTLYQWKVQHVSSFICQSKLAPPVEAMANFMILQEIKAEKDPKREGLWIVRERKRKFRLVRGKGWGDGVCPLKLDNRGGKACPIIQDESS